MPRAHGCSARYRFNPRPRAGGDARVRVISCSFNPRPRAGGDGLPSLVERSFRLSFNPRPRAGGDSSQGAGPDCRVGVSIRAPVRGATGIADQHDQGARHVSIRAPVRGATPAVHRLTENDVFQSAPPCGGRRGGGRARVSSHYRFNPRPRAGGDRRGRGEALPATDRFNPRPRAGGDNLRRSRQHVSWKVSIRAPVRGAT